MGVGWQRFVCVHLLILFSLGHSDPMSKPYSKLYPFNVFQKKANNTQHFIHLVIFLKSWVQITWNTGSAMLLSLFFLHSLCSEPIPLFGTDSEVCVGLSTWGQQATLSLAGALWKAVLPGHLPYPWFNRTCPPSRSLATEHSTESTNTYYVLETLLGTGETAVKK